MRALHYPQTVQVTENLESLSEIMANNLKFRQLALTVER